jgi:hypothetical protein
MAVLLALAVTLGGLHGTVTRGPTKPVCSMSAPCSEPATGALLLFERGGRVAARVRVGAQGHYAVRLAAGTYAVRVSPQPRVGFGIRPATVRVVAGASRRADFEIDTGIR